MEFATSSYSAKTCGDKILPPKTAETAESAARFTGVKENGVFFLRYENAVGAVRSAKVSLSPC